MTWLPIATEALDDNDISISTSSVKEIYNRIEFGLRDWSQLADAKSAIGKTTVPVGAVRLSNAPSGCTRTRTTSAPSGVPSWAASSTGHPFGSRLVDAPSGL